MQIASSWKRSAALLAAALLLPLLVACGGAAPAAEPTKAAEPTAAAAEPTKAPEPTAAPAEPTATAEAAAPASDPKSLKILYWQAPTVLNPHVSSGTKDFDAATVILEPLAHYNEKDELVAYLAEEIPTIENGGVAKDGTSVTWKLKKGVKWSDGTDFTADDVIFTWKYASDPKTAATTASNYTIIKDITAVDANTVKITWAAPTPNPYGSFVSFSGMIIQKKQFENCVGEKALTDAACQAANLAPVGTNAYMLKEFKPGDTVTYVKSPTYRNADKTAFDTVEIKGGGDATTAGNAVCQTAEADYAWNLQVPKAALEPILAGGKCQPIAGGSFGVERIVINFSNPDAALGKKRSEPSQPHPFLTNPKVRQAINMAIDRKAIVENLYGPTGVADCNILVVPESVNSKNTTCERDIEGAKKLMDEAGFPEKDGARADKDGKPLALYFQTSINTLRQGEQAIIKSNLKELGIAVSLKAVDAGVFFSGDVGIDDTLNKMYVDMQMYTNGPDGVDSASYLAGWTCAKMNSAENKWNGGNDGRYCNKDYDALYAKYAAEFDTAKRTALAIELNDMLIKDNAVIPLVNRRTPNAIINGLVGPTYNTFDSGLWNIDSWHK